MVVVYVNRASLNTQQSAPLPSSRFTVYIPEDTPTRNPAPGPEATSVIKIASSYPTDYSVGQSLIYNV